MISLFNTAKLVQDLLLEHEWRFCFIGGIVVQRWGEPRLTQDVDLTIITGYGQEEQFAQTLAKSFELRIPDAIEFAIQNRVLLLKTQKGIAIDISFGALPYEEELIDRASYFRFLPKIELLTCSAEDLLALKIFADRAKDWVDVEGVLLRQKGKLDFNYLQEKLRLLSSLREDSDVLATFERLKRKLGC